MWGLLQVNTGNKIGENWHVPILARISHNKKASDPLFCWQPINYNQPKRNLMPTVCNEGTQVQCEFQQKGPGRIVVDFNGGQITSDGGAVLLSELASQTSI